MDKIYIEMFYMLIKNKNFSIYILPYFKYNIICVVKGRLRKVYKHIIPLTDVPKWGHFSYFLEKVKQ